MVRNLRSVLDKFELRLARRVLVELGLADGVDGRCTLDLRLEGMGGWGVAADLPSVVGISSQPADVVDDCGGTWRTSAILHDEHYGVQTCNNQLDKRRKSGGTRGNGATRGGGAVRGHGGVRRGNVTTIRTRGARAEEREAMALREAVT